MDEQAGRVAGVAEDAVSESRLDAFRREVDWHLGCGALADFDLPVTGDDGGFPVVVALEDERLSIVLGRLRAVGGFANLFVKGNRRVRMASVIDTACAIGTPDDVFTGDDIPWATVTVGFFLDYVERNPNGIAISAAVGHPACARDARTVEFAGSPS
jgi:hypothetical protein